MNTHKNARLAFARRLELVKDMTQRKLGPCTVAAVRGVSAATARNWPGRYLAQGAAGLAGVNVGTRSARRNPPGILRRLLLAEWRSSTMCRLRCRSLLPP